MTVRDKDKHRRPYRKKERETYAEKTNCICIQIYIVRAGIYIRNLRMESYVWHR